MLGRDLTPATTQAALRAGDLERVRRGAFRHPASPGRPADRGARASAARELALARIAAIGRQLRTSFWFSHESAALVWGCALWTPPSRTHIIQTVRPHGQGDPDLARHFVALDPTDRARHRGVPVISLDRTVVDCLTTLRPLDGLVVADSALRIGADRDAILDRIAGRAGRRGVVVARAVMEHADGRAESPWETFVRYVLVSNGLPRPELQVPVHTRLGWFRSDLGWPAWRLLLEFDGITKYSAPTDGDPVRVLIEEKRRQEAIEEEGWGVLRATAADLRRPAALVERVCRRLPRDVTDRLIPVPALRVW